jgi:ADP-heptose:LPS heptosyltransferase
MSRQHPKSLLLLFFRKEDSSDMNDAQPGREDTPLNAVLRRMILHCARDVTARQDQIDCAELLLATGYRAEAKLLYEMIFLHDGFAAESLDHQAKLAERTGLWLNPPARPAAIYPDPGHVTELALADLRRWSAVPHPAPQDAPAPLDIDLRSLCDALCVALRGHATPESLGGLLAAARYVAHAAGVTLPQNEPGGIAAVTEALVHANLRHFMLANDVLAFPPFGSPALFQAAASSHPAGLGAYGRNLQAVVSNGRQMLGLIELAGHAPNTAAFERWAAILCTRLTDGTLHDAVGELGDHGYLRSLDAVLDHALRDPAARPDRSLLMHVRDAGLDDDDLELAKRAQQALAQWWADDKHEWQALGDILAYDGRHDESCAAFRQALRIDPGDDHANASIAALESGDFSRLRNRGGFGTPDHRRAKRAARRHSGVQPRADHRADIARLDEPDIFERLAPELAPREAPRHRYDPGRPLHIRRLGARRARSGWGLLPLLRGVEAIRGLCVSAVPFTELRITLGDRTLYRGVPLAFAVPGAEQGEQKYVFNVWLDVSRLPRGRHEIDIALIDIEGRASRHREPVLIGAPLAEDAAAGSDAVVAPPDTLTMTLEADINARPSMVRAADRRLFAQPPGRVLVIRADQLGDLVCSVPAIRRLRVLLPGARLTGLLTPANAPLAASLALFDDIVTIDFPADPADHRRVMTLEDQAALRARLTACDFDLAIDLSYNPPARPLLLLSGARFLYGCRERDFSYLDLGFEAPSHDPINGSECVPASAKILAMVEWLGIAMGAPPAAVEPTAQSRDRLTPLGLAGRRYAVLHAGARLAFSRWPYFRELAALIVEHTDLDVVLIGDEAAGPCQHAGRVRVLDEALDFGVFDALVSFCAVLVGNDSGPKHLAALRGVPVVGIHCARNNWNEWGQATGGVIISRRVPCAGCQIHYEEEECGKDFACMTHIRPAEVYEAMVGVLAKKRKEAVLF